MSLNYKKSNNNPFLSKPTLKYQAYSEVFWFKVRRQQNQCISRRWCFINAFAITCQKSCNTNVTIQTMFFQTCFLTRYKFLYKKVKVKKKFFVAVWVFLIFRFSFSFFDVFLLSLAMSGNLKVACIFFDIFFVFKEELCSTWKKNHVQVMVFNKKAVVKISRISNPKSPLWNLFKFRREYLLINVSRIVCWMF